MDEVKITEDTSTQSLESAGSVVQVDAAKMSSDKKKKKPELADKTLACRYELKYRLTESKAHAVAEFVKHYIPVDRYCKLQRGGDYPIVSLYLDSVNSQLCKESIDGRQNRFKLRIRSYTDEPDYPVFFEIKRRINTVIMKSRARLMHEDIIPVLAGLPLGPRDYNVDMKALNQFQLYVASVQAKPSVLIRYMRQAFEGDSDNRVRVTFDRDLCYCVTDKPEVRLGGGGWQRNPVTENSGVILEIKFTGSYPIWLSRMVKYFDLKSRSISKFATSITDSCSLRFCAPQLAR
ncbi:MAG: polyphosphate polymerase domain-containing protein [Sedimentisphaerales bacterium]|nr:polyphosphate polymerase domain-containing protein [Sedimentisphaerales bacterium]